MEAQEVVSTHTKKNWSRVAVSLLHSSECSQKELYCKGSLKVATCISPPTTPLFTPVDQLVMSQDLVDLEYVGHKVN